MKKHKEQEQRNNNNNNIGSPLLKAWRASLDLGLR